MGAMGAVFKGHHEGMGLDVAVKVLNPKLGRKEPKTLKRFVREVRLLAAINNPHVVRVYDAGQQDKYTYMIMELVKGQSLDSLRRQEGGRMRPGAVAYYLRQVALGLHAVHQCGVVHRDIKPDNIMVDTRGQTKIADFGLARGQDSVQLTLSDEVVGTPEYMSPEVIAHEDVSGKADQYSLGITAYELITGETPFNKGNLLKIVQEHLRSPVPPLSLKSPECPPDLAAIVHRLLEKKQEDRYADAKELAALLSPLADSEPPHRPTAESDRLPMADRETGVRIPEWHELFMIKLLVQHRVYEQDALLKGLVAWRQHPDLPFANFLVQHGGLPSDTAGAAMQAARQTLGRFRDRIGFGLLKSSGLLSPEQLDALAREPLPPGVSLAASLVQRHVLTAGDAQSFESAIDAAFENAFQHCLSSACQQFGVEAGPLGQLKSRLSPPQYDEVYKATVAKLSQQLG
jgi:serine/threonine protein kinase